MLPISSQHCAVHLLGRQHRVIPADQTDIPPSILFDPHLQMTEELVLASKRAQLVSTDRLRTQQEHPAAVLHSHTDRVHDSGPQLQQHLRCSPHLQKRFSRMRGTGIMQAVAACASRAGKPGDQGGGLHVGMACRVRPLLADLRLRHHATRCCCSLRHRGGRGRGPAGRQLAAGMAGVPQSS